MALVNRLRVKAARMSALGYGDVAGTMLAAANEIDRERGRRDALGEEFPDFEPYPLASDRNGVEVA